ncbi:MAG: glycosyltransferase family 2 protein [Bryobacteraceae bacterium]|nr:glycosyltransferase family 2 protein [Bryobacteraceae bacterium]
MPASFSVVVPTYNRRERLKRCLASLRGLTFPRERLEIIVVDDGSTPPFRARRGRV